MLDADGYLRITGRLKEIINRGGEKISPLEVDEVLMDHPAVAQVVTFAMPHDKLGEEVAAAVVLREGLSASERGDPRLRRRPGSPTSRCRARSSSSTEIPKGATGKLQRIGLAQKLGLGRMKICIYGAGAIGGYLGARLAIAGEEVSLIARGPHLAAMRERGLDAAGPRRDRRPDGPPGHRRPRRARAAGLRDRGPEGACGAGGGAG